MKLNNLLNDYVECNTFEIKIIKEKLYVYYYDRIDNFSENKIKISDQLKSIVITGKKLVIETMFKEFLVISGNIDNIKLEGFYE